MGCICSKREEAPNFDNEYIYMIKSVGEHSGMKIGSTKNPAARLNSYGCDKEYRPQFEALYRVGMNRKHLEQDLKNDSMRKFVRLRDQHKEAGPEIYLCSHVQFEHWMTRNKIKFERTELKAIAKLNKAKPK